MSVEPSSSLTAARGFLVASGTCGIKPSGKPDLMTLFAEGPTTTAGCFTRNRVPGAPVLVSKRRVRSGAARAIVCNSGNSNVCTGKRGVNDARAMCRHAARALGVREAEVLICSTGVIGRRLPMSEIERGLESMLPSKLARGPHADARAAEAILTTDLRPKQALRTLTLGGERVHLGGIAKGSGMVAPDMATMLAFITTDARIESRPLQWSLRESVDRTFNRLSIDEDTSTSDSVLMLASGRAGPALEPGGPDEAAFREALDDLCRDLSLQIVRDGEGATRVMHVHVRGARSTRDADRVGKAVVGSPLVKTALHGGDPNWGRLVMAIGRSGASVKPARLSIRIGEHPVVRGGEPEPDLARYAQSLTQAMRRDHVHVSIDLGLGECEADWLGCDLSRDYIHINADYTT